MTSADLNRLNMLALDTGTEEMSIALARAQPPGLWQHTGLGSSHSSGRLIAEIQTLLRQAGLSLPQLSVIAFGAGPGSFTGLRTACSVAQGLGFGLGLSVLPVDSLLAVAEEARWQMAGTDGFGVTAVLDARMDEIYSASYLFASGAWQRLQDWRLSKPEDLQWNGSTVLAGNAAAVYGARLPSVPSIHVHALPTASAMLRLAPWLLAAGLAVAPAQALPVYVRNKVAQTTTERNSQRQLAP